MRVSALTLLAIAPLALAQRAKVCNQFPYILFEWISVFPQASSACSSQYPVAAVTSFTTLPVVTQTTTVATVTTTVATTTSTQHLGTVTATADTATLTSFTTTTYTSILSTTDHTGQTISTVPTVVVTAATPTTIVTTTSTATSTITFYLDTTTVAVPYTPPAAKRTAVSNALPLERRKSGCKANDWWCQEWEALGAVGKSFVSTLCACIEATPTVSVTRSPNSVLSVTQTVLATQTVMTNIPSSTTLYPSLTITTTQTISTTQTDSTNIPATVFYTPSTTSTPPIVTSTVTQTITVQQAVEGGTSTVQSACPAATPNVCGGSCVNTATSISNCGKCGKACANTEVCQKGSCTAFGTFCNNPTTPGVPFTDPQGGQHFNRCANQNCYCVPTLDHPSTSIGACVKLGSLLYTCDSDADCPNPGSVCLNGVNAGIIYNGVTYNVCSIPADCIPPSSKRDFGGIVGPRGVQMYRNPSDWTSIKQRAESGSEVMAPTLAH